jgi:hypothetical protein
MIAYRMADTRLRRSMLWQTGETLLLEGRT